MLPRFAGYAEAALDLIFPARCVGCGEEGQLLCPSCLRSLPRISPPVCPRCGKPEMNGIICPTCTTWQSKIDSVRSPFRFDGAIREAVHQLKYKSVRTLANPLALLLAQYFLGEPIAADMLIPVPLHPKKLKERGYNQSALIASRLAPIIGLPVRHQLLFRTKYSVSQARANSVEERRRNVEDAFDCGGAALTDLNVLLIDDVATTCATLDACAQALRLAGARSVKALVLAREL